MAKKRKTNIAVDIVTDMISEQDTWRIKGYKGK